MISLDKHSPTIMCVWSGLIRLPAMRMCHQHQHHFSGRFAVTLLDEFSYHDLNPPSHLSWCCLYWPVMFLAILCYFVVTLPDQFEPIMNPYQSNRWHWAPITFGWADHWHLLFPLVAPHGTAVRIWRLQRWKWHWWYRQQNGTGTAWKSTDMAKNYESTIIVMVDAWCWWRLMIVDEGWWWLMVDDYNHVG